MTMQLLDLLGHADLFAHWIGDDDFVTLAHLLSLSRAVQEQLRAPLWQWLREIFDTEHVQSPRLHWLRFCLQLHNQNHLTQHFADFVKHLHGQLGRPDPPTGKLLTLASWVLVARVNARLLRGARWEGAIIKYDRASNVERNPTIRVPLRDVFYHDERQACVYPLMGLPGVTECDVCYTRDEHDAICAAARDSVQAYMFVQATRDRRLRHPEFLALWYYVTKAQLVHHAPRDETLLGHVFVDRVPLYSPCNSVMSALRGRLYTHADSVLSLAEKRLGLNLSLCITDHGRHLRQCLTRRDYCPDEADRRVTLGVQRQLASIDNWAEDGDGLIYSSGEESDDPPALAAPDGDVASDDDDMPALK
jgi:hypothetical protein